MLPANSTVVSSGDEFTINDGYFPPLGMTYASTAAEIARRTRKMGVLIPAM